MGTLKFILRLFIETAYSTIVKAILSTSVTTRFRPIGFKYFSW